MKPEAPLGCSSPGTVLVSARLRAGLSLDALSKRTRISRSWLEALERDAWEELPAMVYVRGFMRVHAKEVGLDPSEPLSLLDAELESQLAAEDLAASDAEAAEHRVRLHTFRVGAAYALAVGAAISFILAALFFLSPPELEAHHLDASSDRVQTTAGR